MVDLGNVQSDCSTFGFLIDRWPEILETKLPDSEHTAPTATQGRPQV